MKTVIFIPARYASSRYPGKPLVCLKQPHGKEKTLIEINWEAACKVKNIDEVFVPTDDERIAMGVQAFGGKVIMTDPDCENGTVRCADALLKLNETAPDVVVNFQGDAPLTPPWFVEELIAIMKAEP